MKTKMDFERKKFQKLEDQMNSKNFTKGNGSKKLQKKNPKNFRNEKIKFKNIGKFFKTSKKD